MKTISVLNLKGGVGKTLTTVNMAYELFRRGFKVLLIDNDKQGNLSKAYGVYETDSIAPITRILTGKWKLPAEVIKQTAYDAKDGVIDIVPANMSLFGATWNLTADKTVNQTDRYKSFLAHSWECSKKDEIHSLTDFYDYCIIDNPPDIGLNVINALVASDSVIVPIKIDEWALEGLGILTEQIEDARRLNPRLGIQGILVTEYRNTDAEAAGVEWIAQNSNYNLLGIIRYSAKVAESTFNFKPIYEYSPCSAAAQDYKRLATTITGKDRKGGRK